MDQRVITLFHESIEAKMQAGEELAPLIADASQVIVNALLSDRKILTCGNGISAAQAQIFTACLLDRFEHERPSLPALSLGTDFTTQTALSSGYSFNDVYARQIRAIGQAGDVLLLLSSDGNAGLQSFARAGRRCFPLVSPFAATGTSAWYAHLRRYRRVAIAGKRSHRTRTNLGTLSQWRSTTTTDGGISRRLITDVIQANRNDTGQGTAG